MLSYKRKRDHLQFALTIYNMCINVYIYRNTRKKRYRKTHERLTEKKSWKPARCQTVQFKKLQPRCCWSKSAGSHCDVNVKSWAKFSSCKEGGSQLVWLISRCETVFADYLTNSKIFQKCSSLFLALCICHHPATPWCDFSQQRYIDYIDHVGQLSDSKKLLHHFGKNRGKGQSLCQQKLRFFIPSRGKSCLSIHSISSAFCCLWYNSQKSWGTQRQSHKNVARTVFTINLRFDLKKKTCLNRFNIEKKICGTKGGRPSCNPKLSKVLMCLSFSFCGSNIRLSFNQKLQKKHIAWMPGWFLGNDIRSLQLQLPEISHGCGFLSFYSSLLTRCEKWKGVFLGEKNLTPPQLMKTPTGVAWNESK